MSRKEKTLNDTVSVFLLNIQGLTVHKWNEWQEMICGCKNDIRISMLTETQHKVEKVFFGTDYKYEVAMRSEQDKKGGGLMIGSNDAIGITRVESGNPDVLCVDIEMRNMKMRVVLTYWDASEDNRNGEIVTCIRSILDQFEGKLMILGDMNAHVGFLGEQQLNKNGERLLDLMEDCRLIMLNLDESCTGEITREQGMHTSVIDFVLVNELLYKDFIAMDIDEKKDVFDLSDHCMIRIDFKLNTKERDDTTRKSVEY